MIKIFGFKKKSRLNEKKSDLCIREAFIRQDV
jgi:hypothetical protein